MRKKKKYKDVSNAKTQNNFLASEEFPEGSYGHPVGENASVENKETPWEEGQQYYSSFVYENRGLHKDIPRQMEGAHPPHDEEAEKE
ncbi:hypothetical protein [Saliterribacillus persicus]|uniref:Cytosolic protein n=1 Tax=Saliterribacillus persicus TaxID=930114 RepID=A0A368XA73_9BACI|nr:hypothetical protein [Saliterribacillus persicus]RCW63908.1 hypothetical protein DFR57_11533 [Saliterribacillus persicus]